MTGSVVAQRTDASPPGGDVSPSPRLRVGGLLGYVSLLTLLFVQPLARLVSYAFQSDLHSHIPLVPLIAGYLLYVQPRPALAAYGSSIGGTLVSGAIGLAAVAAWTGIRGSLSVNDDLALMTLAYLSLVTAGVFLFLGAKWMASAAFPIGFLIFMVPLPDAAVHWMERGLVLASADAAALLFNLSGTPLHRDGTVLALPSVVLEVARECSGIRSTWVLLITAVLASHLFLEKPWRRILLVTAVIPLGILRNGFRILVIGLLCEHVGPHMVDSVIHRRGGPIFFVLSLIPLFMLLWWLRRQEHRRSLPA